MSGYRKYNHWLVIRTGLRFKTSTPGNVTFPNLTCSDKLYSAATKELLLVKARLKNTNYGEGVESALTDLNSNVYRNPVPDVVSDIHIITYNYLV